jgi:hypothetical protein
MELKLTPEIIKKLSIKVDSFVYLWLISIGEEPNFDKSLELMMDGYIFPGGKITKKGLDLVDSVIGVKKVSLAVNYGDIIIELKKTMKKFVGKEQIQGFGGVYFRPTEVELKQFLERFWKYYPECKDVSKITKVLNKHIETCSKKNTFAPAIKYFILKEQSKGMYVSQLASAYDSFEEKEETKTTTFEL